MEKDCLQLLIEEGSQDAEAFVACATELWKMGQNEISIEACDKALEFEPNNAQAYNRRGTAKSDLGQNMAAILDFDYAIELDPNCVRAYSNRGNAKSELGQNLQAIRDFDRAIELDPDNAGFYNNRGAAKIQLEQYVEAILDFDRAIELDPNEAGTYGNRSAAKIKLGQKDEAIPDLDRAIELNPDYKDAYRNRGAAKSDLGQKGAAIIDLDRAIELDPNDAVSYSNRAAAKSDLGQKDAAMIDLDRAIDLDPNFAPAYNNRGIIKFDLHQKHAAIRDYDRAIKLDPNFAHAYNNRGFANYSLGMQDAAMFDFNRAIELAPDYSNPYFNRGIAKFALGQNVESILDLNRAIELDLENAEYHFNRGVIEHTLGQAREARKDFLRSLSLQKKELIADFLSQYLRIWSDEYPAPYLIYQLLATHSYIQGFVSIKTLVMENIRQCHAALVWSAYQEATKHLTNLETTWFYALLHLGMGDIITAYKLFNNLYENNHDDLAIQYYLQQTAADILEPERETLLKNALIAAKALKTKDGATTRQWFYAGRIMMAVSIRAETLTEQAEARSDHAEAEVTQAEAIALKAEAMECYRQAGDWWPAVVALAALEDEIDVSGIEYLTEGLPIHHIETGADRWLEMLDDAILFYELEFEITLITYGGYTFPRFWGIWDVEALVEPLREAEATKRETWLKSLFTEKYEDATADRKADAGRFDHHFDVKTAFDLLKRSKTLDSDLALAIGTSRLPAEVHAAFIEYFYLRKKLPATEVFYLFFYLVKCRGKESPGALLAGTQEAQKSLLENLLKPSLAFLGFFGDAAAAGMAEFLKALYWQLFEKLPSMLGKPGESTAYDQFKAGFKTHIYETMEALGGKEEFLKRYPIEGFLV